MKIKPTSSFKGDLKKYKHNVTVLKELDVVLKILLQKKELPEKYRDHILSGEWNYARECHIKPDVLLIYHTDIQENLLRLIRIGSPSELFK